MVVPCNVLGDLPRVSPCAIHSSSSLERVTFSAGSTLVPYLPLAISETSLASCFFASAMPTPFSRRGCEQVFVTCLPVAALYAARGQGL